MNEVARTNPELSAYIEKALRILDQYGEQCLPIEKRRSTRPSREDLEREYITLTAKAIIKFGEDTLLNIIDKLPQQYVDGRPMHSHGRMSIPAGLVNRSGYKVALEVARQMEQLRVATDAITDAHPSIGTKRAIEAALDFAESGIATAEREVCPADPAQKD